MKHSLSSLMKYILCLLCFTFFLAAESLAQRNDLSRSNSKKEKTEDSALTYDGAIRLYGPPDQEKQKKDGSLVCTWTQTMGVQGDFREGVSGGNTMKMVIFFSKDGLMTDRKYLNCPVFFSDSVFRLK